MDRKYEQNDITRLLLTFMHILGDLPANHPGMPSKKEWQAINELINRIDKEKLDIRLVSREY